MTILEGGFWKHLGDISLSRGRFGENVCIITSSSDTFVFKMPQKTRPNNQTYPESM